MAESRFNKSSSEIPPTGIGGTSNRRWKWFDMTQYDSTRHPEKFSCIRMNIRNFSRSTSPNTNRRSTTRERQ
jgi:hypothetical protein